MTSIPGNRAPFQTGASPQLRERIEVQSATLTDDGAGGQTKVWAGPTIAAGITPVGGREALLAGAAQAVQGYRVLMRWRPALTPADRLLWGSTVLNIRSAADPDGKRKWTVVYAEAGTVDE